MLSKSALAKSKSESNELSLLTGNVCPGLTSDPADPKGVDVGEIGARPATVVCDAALLLEFARPGVSGLEMVAVRHNQPTHYEVPVAHPVRRVHPRHESSYRMLACV